MFLCIVSTVAAAKGKIVEIKGLPKTIKGIADVLPRETKDPARRALLSLMLDDLLRALPETNDPRVVDEITGTLLNDVFEQMAGPGDTFSTEYGPDKYHPRVDVFFKEQVKLRPGRNSKDFQRKYTKKMQGSQIDRGYKDQPMTVSVSTAASDAELMTLTDTKFWGALVHAVHIDPATGVARIGVTFISNGTKDKPGGRFERPSWVGFYRQAKPGVGSYQLLALERETTVDWREQQVNLVPPKTEPTELSRKLYLAVWMEQVRGIPVRPAFLEQEARLFAIDFETTGKLELPQVAWLDRYRESDSPMVRAAAELKVGELGGDWKPETVDLVSRGMKHPVVKAKLEELMKRAPAGYVRLPPLPPEPEPAPDAGK